MVDGRWPRRILQDELLDEEIRETFMSTEEIGADFAE
jgi:hypothetical protein